MFLVHCKMTYAVSIFEEYTIQGLENISVLKVGKDGVNEGEGFISLRR